MQRRQSAEQRALLAAGRRLAVNTPAGLSTSLPPSQRSPVESRKCLSGAAMLPIAWGCRGAQAIRLEQVVELGMRRSVRRPSGAATVVVGATGGTVRRRLPIAPALSRRVPLGARARPAAAR
jgi:hypothetical protein